MLSELFIRNVAVIQKARIPFGPGLNAITGETGAGKTILISSIDAVLGERTSRDVIRTGEDKAQITAMFTEVNHKAKEILEEFGLEDDEDTVIITREITAAGKSSCRINEMPATTSMLRQLAPHLIHIHGQRDAQQLLENERHLEMVDLYCGLAAKREEYQTAYGQMRDLERQLAELQMDESDKAQRLDLLRFQIGEIEEAELEDPEEEEALQAQKRLILGSERVRDGLVRAYNALQGDGELPGVSDLLQEAQTAAADVGEVVGSYAETAARMEAISYELAEFAVDIRDTLDELDFDPQELDRIEHRLDLIYRLKKKYGGEIAAILHHHQNAVEELDRVEGNEEHIARLEQELGRQTALCHKKAKALSAQRQKGAKKLLSLVEQELHFLEMPSAKMSLYHQYGDLASNGIDDLAFYIVTNAGEPPKPLSRIASGGELARVMLALKNVLAEQDGVDTLIFDEVDSGVSGRAAGRIGQKLREASRSRQVICVTHLAQVAAFADQHLLIEKNTKDGRTYTEVQMLDTDGAVGELARITSADVVTEKALQSARELWQRAHER